MKEKPTQEVCYELNMTDFYRDIEIAIDHKNLQSIYQLSKIITRYHFRKLDN